MTARFRVSRLPNMRSNEIRTYTFWPWIVRDREHPSRLERFYTHSEAIAHVDEQLGYVSHNAGGSDAAP